MFDMLIGSFLGFKSITCFFPSDSENEYEYLKYYISDFGAFQEKMHMLSREKYLLQMLFGAFQDTSRTLKEII